MKTSRFAILRAGVAMIMCTIAYAVPALAKKPIPEPPPPAGPAYTIIPVDYDFSTWSISDAGSLVGSAPYEWAGGWFLTPAVLSPRLIGDSLLYALDDIDLLPVFDGSHEYGDCVAMNNAGVSVGFVTPGKAILWRADGSPIDLGVAPPGLLSTGNDINDSGLVLAGVGIENEPGERSVVVAPVDTDGDGEPDTWFRDLDTDGVNDLLFPIDVGHNLLALVINEFAQVLAPESVGGELTSGYLLTPDFADADGDGNPWYADEDADGFNDLLQALEAPVPGTPIRVAGLNNAGQVAGDSGGHVVRWEFVDGVQIVADLGSFSDKTRMTATGISDTGRITGTSRIPTGRRSKDGPSWVIENDILYELLPLIVNASRWSDLEALGMNRHGWIQGRGVLDGIWHRFVAIPAE